MPKTHRGGQGAAHGSLSQSHTGIKVQMPAQQPTPQVQAVPQPAAPMPSGNRNFKMYTDADASALISANMDAYDDPDFNYARKLYVSDATDAAGFSFSQNLNYKLDNGIRLNANEQFMADMLGNGMRPIGKDTVLFRAAHDDILKQLGIKDYTKLTQAQLQQKLVGTTMQTTSYTSWSYDKSKNPFLPGQAQGGGREVYIIGKAQAGTKMFFGAKSQAEVVTNVGTNLKITNVYYDGTRATPRLRSNSVPRVVIEVESW